MNQESLQQAARVLARARTRREPIDELDPTVRPVDEAGAYAIQAVLHEELGAAGHGELVGYKIGCTTPVMQRFLGIDNPCAGGVFAPTVIERAGAVDFDRYLHVGVECEIAVRLAKDLFASAPSFEAAADAVAAVMPAIEIVDDRWRDYRAVSAPSLIADDFFGAGCVLGAPREDVDLRALADLQGGMRINGEAVGRGRGADILGHPLNALIWLVTNLHARGTRLRAGEFVLLGSLVQTVWVERGARVEVAIGGLGEASLRFD